MRGPAAIFVQIDTDKDGKATWEETWVFVQQRFAAADADHNGSLSQQEMQAAMAANRPQRPRGGDDTAAPRPNQAGREAHFAQMSGAMFRALDADRNGQVTLEEVKPAVEARFRAMDANLDNVVARDEVPQPMHRHHGPRGRGGPAGNPPPPATAPANPG
jgi:hypothetical protein